MMDTDNNSINSYNPDDAASFRFIGAPTPK